MARYWTERRIIAAIEQDARRRGRPPRKREWQSRAPGRPTAETVRTRFGSWSGGLEAAGLAAHARDGRTCRRGHPLPGPDARGKRACPTSRRETDRARRARI